MDFRVTGIGVALPLAEEGVLAHPAVLQHLGYAKGGKPGAEEPVPSAHLLLWGGVPRPVICKGAGAGAGALSSM